MDDPLMNDSCVQFDRVRITRVATHWEYPPLGEEEANAVQQQQNPVDCIKCIERIPFQIAIRTLFDCWNLCVLYDLMHIIEILLLSAYGVPWHGNKAANNISYCFHL